MITGSGRGDVSSPVCPSQCVELHAKQKSDTSCGIDNGNACSDAFSPASADMVARSKPLTSEYGAAADAVLDSATIIKIGAARSSKKV